MSRNAARISRFLNAVFAEIRKTEALQDIDIETGEVKRIDLPIGQRVRVDVEHSQGCASWTAEPNEGFVCTCSPEIFAKLVGVTRQTIKQQEESMKALSQYTWAERVAVAMAVANTVYEQEPRDESIDFTDLCKWFFETTDQAKIDLQTQLAPGLVGPGKPPQKPDVVRQSLPAFIPNCKDVVGVLKGSDGFTDDEVIDVATVYFGLSEPQRDYARTILVEDRWRDQLRVAIFHLRKVGCDPVDPLTLSVTVWPEASHDNKRIDQLDEAGEEEFTRLHWLACEALDMPPFAPDLRPPPACTRSMLEHWERAYEFAALAGQSHADALGEFARRKFGDDWKQRAKATEH
jgi:hypothetical protein